MSINADGLADLISTLGESITIGSVTPSLYHGTAIVNGGGGNWMSIAGGYYEKIQFSLTVRKTDISFLPTPGMPVDARGYALRIPDNGVTDYREHYHIIAVARAVPQ